MIIFEDDVVGFKTAYIFVIIELIEEREWNDTLNDYFSKNDLPIACGTKSIILGNEALHVQPLEIDEVAKDQGDDVNHIKRESNPHEDFNILHFITVSRPVLYHVVIILLICDHLEAESS